MTQNVRTAASATVRAENIGGIDETTVTLQPGVTALVGPNATNRTSLLQAIAGALGSDAVTLKADAEEGRAALELDGETYTRRLRRTGGSVETSGDPYLDDPDLADLYAVLLNENEVRRAVRRDENLRSLIMRPIDTAEIREEIATLVDERGRIDTELDRLDALAEDLPELESERRELDDRLEELEDRLAEKRAAREERERADGDDRTDVEATLESKLDALGDARAELERVTEDRSIERKSLESLREERAAVEEEFESLAPVDDERLAVVRERIADLRERKGSLESTVSELQRVVRFNEQRLEEGGAGPLDELDGGGGSEPVTDRLVSAGTTTCWTCGSEVERRRIEETVDRLRDLRRQTSEERREVAEELSDLGEELDELERRRDERSRLADRLEELETELDRREENVETLEARRADLEDRVDELEREVEELQASQQDDLLSLQQEVSELEFERDRVAEELDDLESEIEAVESELARREELESRRADISEDLTELRTRIERIEREAVEAFNTHMEALLDRLGYDNIERIWIESTEEPVGDGTDGVTEKGFGLHVVRQSGSGTAYEDRLDHLSESERELVGLVVALAGYLAHDVQERVPFMLLDSLEMIDGERLVELVGYLEEYVPFLVVVLLPDHAAAFDATGAPDHRRVTEI